MPICRLLAENNPSIARNLSEDNFYGLNNVINLAINSKIRKFSALAFVPLEDIEKGCTNIDNIPITPDHDTFKFIKYFVDTWLKGKYGFFWNHFDNTGPITNNHLEGYHAKLSAIPSAKTSNILTSINMIKKSATQIAAQIPDPYGTSQSSIMIWKKEKKKKKKLERKEKFFLENTLKTNNFQEPKAKKIKSDASGDIYYLETRSHERVPISKSLLVKTQNQELNNFHITEFQNLITHKYNVTGLFMPDYYTIENYPFNPEYLRESVFIQVENSHNHWVVISNYHSNVILLFITA
ncbi:unnamed protein product [Brachionus calyciflorus]|uniref:Uncharacterized protein n=1 Tax=Brachionus calyciflorus TaxID=104777 RepID=A0A814B514_9BILA|nr:unnamed protein product [Brachionus calyciflorus]